MQGRILIMAAILMLVLSVPLMASSTPRHWFVPVDTTDIVCASDTLDRSGGNPGIAPGGDELDGPGLLLRSRTALSKYALANVGLLWRRVL